MATGDGRAATADLRRLFEGGTAAGLADGPLLDRFVLGDDPTREAAFAALVDRHGPMVWRACREVCGDPHEAQDASQATFLVLARKADSLRVRGSLAPWLHEVAVRTASASRRASARRHRLERAAAERLADSPARSRPDADLGPILHEEISRLPDRYRIPVVLCGLEGLTRDEAAGRLGWPVGTVQSRLARGRARLRDRLARRGMAPGAGLLPAGPLSRLDPIVRDALSLACARTFAAGTVPGAALRLADSFSREILMAQWKLVSACVLAATAATLAAAGVFVLGQARPAPPPSAVAKGQGGGPAAGDFLVVGGQYLIMTGPKAPLDPAAPDDLKEFVLLARPEDGWALFSHRVHAGAEPFEELINLDTVYQIVRFETDESRAARPRPVGRGVRGWLQPGRLYDLTPVGSSRPVDGPDYRLVAEPSGGWAAFSLRRDPDGSSPDVIVNLAQIHSITKREVGGSGVR